jgi:hypothetical protein
MFFGLYRMMVPRTPTAVHHGVRRAPEQQGCLKTTKPHCPQLSAELLGSPDFWKSYSVAAAQDCGSSSSRSAGTLATALDHLGTRRAASLRERAIAANV